MTDGGQYFEYGYNTTWCAVHVSVLRASDTNHMNIHVKHHVRICAYLYQNPRCSASCAVNHQIYDEARAVLV